MTSTSRNRGIAPWMLVGVTLAVTENVGFSQSDRQIIVASELTGSSFSLTDTGPAQSDSDIPTIKGPQTTPASAQQISRERLPTQPANKSKEQPFPHGKTSQDEKPCVGMGCDEEDQQCLGLGCGETDVPCIGMGCSPRQSLPAPAITLQLFDRKGAILGRESRVQSGHLRITATLSGGPLDSNPLYQFGLYHPGQTVPFVTSGDFSPRAEWIWSPLVPANFVAQRFTLGVTVKLSNRQVVHQESGPYLIVNDDGARRAFSQMFEILSSPRCLNCHARGNSPTQGDDRHLHRPPVTRNTDCTQCHGTSNGTTLGSPPGAFGWRMPPEQFSFPNKSMVKLCRQLKDPATNGGRSLSDLKEHVLRSRLVEWAWSPGPGRLPAPSTWEHFLGTFAAWIRAGHACPESEPTLKR